MSNTKDSKISNSWLQRLKEESWEAELLVSTIAIFGTFQLFGLIDWWTNLFINLLSPEQYYTGYIIVFFGLFAVSILASMFVLHFILRAYWVGLVGLNSVFPDYSLEDSAYSKIYTEKILAILPKLKDSIKKVDELCSVIFSVAFTLMLIGMYMAFMSTILLLLYNLLSPYVHDYILLGIFLAFVILLIFQIIISIIANLKRFKENEKMQTLYFNVVKWGGIVMQGPFYKSILQVTMIFGSNFKKKKSMIYMIMAFLFLGIVLTVNQIQKTNILYLLTHEKKVDKMNMNPSFYASSNEKNNFLLVPEIKSDFVKENVLKVFIPVFHHEKKMRENTCNNYITDETRTKEEQRQDKFDNYLDCYKTYHHILINGKEVNVDFLKYDHPRTDQFGVLGYIKLNKAQEGINTLMVKKVLDKEEYNKEWSIPFYYVAK